LIFQFVVVKQPCGDSTGACCPDQDSTKSSLAQNEMVFIDLGWSCSNPFVEQLRRSWAYTFWEIIAIHFLKAQFGYILNYMRYTNFEPVYTTGVLFFENSTWVMDVFDLYNRVLKKYCNELNHLYFQEPRSLSDNEAFLSWFRLFYFFFFFFFFLITRFGAVTSSSVRMLTSIGCCC